LCRTLVAPVSAIVGLCQRGIGYTDLPIRRSRCPVLSAFFHPGDTKKVSREQSSSRRKTSDRTPAERTWPLVTGHPLIAAIPPPNSPTFSGEAWSWWQSLLPGGSSAVCTGMRRWARRSDRLSGGGLSTAGRWPVPGWSCWYWLCHGCCV